MLDCRPTWAKLREQGLKRTTRTLGQFDVHPKGPKGLTLLMATDGSEREEIIPNATRTLHKKQQRRKGHCRLNPLTAVDQSTYAHTLDTKEICVNLAHSTAEHGGDHAPLPGSRGRRRDVYRKLYTDAQLIHYIACAFTRYDHWSTPGTQDTLLPNVQTTIPPTTGPTPRAPYAICKGKGE